MCYRPHLLLLFVHIFPLHLFQSLLEVHSTASKHDDAQLTDFLEGNFLKEQVEAIKHLGDLVTKMKRAGDGLGVHIIDKELSD